ncbi:glycoside hydrolase family 128 protein [Hypoxylon fragiforme]|uniref:glycoside hydrolase family 128 protein n=1 Tax=Hypoxylon fragiforme TaxID=63214 RepID=UPI0020C63C82|nr:glycoside hydrolase family 128 protein [Hypoxylon fragiforme]KAI2610618.1 glycoside hydrolase family 128 protein [Hypoxylon fragiforme]
MVRVLQSTSGNDWNMIQDTKYPIILFFNEPERAGISPEQARDIWYKQMLPLRKSKGKKLGSPAVASDENGRKWIEKFMSLVASEPPDFLCLHYYSKNPDEAIKYIQDMHNKWPKQKVMVTEIACIDRDYNAVVAFTVKICNWLDTQEWVFEYGLFDFQRKVADDFVSPAAQLMDGAGNFTELGKMYVNQQPIKAPGKTDVAVNALNVPDNNSIETKTGGGVAQDPGAAIFEDPEVSVNINEDFIAAAALDPDQQQALNIHNEKRKSKGVGPLAWDNQLAKYAEDYAKHLVQTGKLEHSTGDQRPNQGENLAGASDSKDTPMVMATEMWIGEEKNYHGEPIGQGDFGSYGHYTQCVWKSTTKIGLGWAKDAKGGVYVVGRYSPPGNFTGQKPY